MIAIKALCVQALTRCYFQTTSPIRDIFKQAFKNAELHYFTPHTFRNTLVRYGMQACITTEEFKAWSQNLAHKNLLTTFTSYDTIDTHRQGELIRGIEVANQQEDKLGLIIKALNIQAMQK